MVGIFANFTPYFDTVLSLQITIVQINVPFVVRAILNSFEFVYVFVCVCVRASICLSGNWFGEYSFSKLAGFALGKKPANEPICSNDLGHLGGTETLSADFNSGFWSRFASSANICSCKPKTSINMKVNLQILKSKLYKDRYLKCKYCCIY